MKRQKRSLKPSSNTVRRRLKRKTIGRSSMPSEVYFQALHLQKRKREREKKRGRESCLPQQSSCHLHRIRSTRFFPPLLPLPPSFSPVSLHSSLLLSFPIINSLSHHKSSWQWSRRKNSRIQPLKSVSLTCELL